MPNLANKLAPRSERIHRQAVSALRARRDFQIYQQGIADGTRSPKVRKGPKHAKKLIRKANRQYEMTLQRSVGITAAVLTKPIRTLADL